MFKNRHVIIALLVAPILSIISYFAVDYAVSEKPHSAVKGQAYQLAEKPNCRYESGQCELKNGDFNVRITAETTEQGNVLLHLVSEHPLQGAGLAIIDSDDDQTKPTPMQTKDADPQHWVASFPKTQTDKDNSRLRVAIAANDTFYYAESSLAFIDYETAYHKDFR